MDGTEVGGHVVLGTAAIGTKETREPESALCVGEELGCIPRIVRFLC